MGKKGRVSPRSPRRSRRRRRPRSTGNYGAKAACCAQPWLRPPSNSFVTPAEILEHFKSRLFEMQERFSEMCDRLIELRRAVVRYCIAQRLGRRRDPAPEEACLFMQIALLLCNKMAHGVAQGRDMVFRLMGIFAPPEAELGKRRRQGDQ